MVNKYMPTSEDYRDNDLYGPRQQINRCVSSLKAQNDPDCVIFGSNTFADKREQWKMIDLIGYDKRLSAMLTDKDSNDKTISYAFPIQSYCWPKMHNTSFPLLCIAPQGGGKTYAHLLYTVTQSIKRIPMHETDLMLKGEASTVYEVEDGQDLNELRNYPKCLIIVSTHDQAESLVRTIERLKTNAYGSPSAEQRNLRFMPPIARSVSVDQHDDKLVFKCHESEIVIGTPPAMIKCLELRAINFAKADRIVFDNVDLCLQLWNSKIRELISIYACQTTESAPPPSVQREVAKDSRGLVKSSKTRYSQMIMFSRKWTELVKKFVTALFSQRTIIFGSMAEASIFLNIRFDLETYTCPNDKIQRLILLIKFLSDSTSSAEAQKFAIVCAEEDEAYELKRSLIDKIDCKIHLIDQEQLSQHASYNSRQGNDSVVIITDSAIDFEVEFSTSRRAMNNITHLIHYSMPSDMIIFDRRFRLMSKKIREEANGLTSTVFAGPDFPSSLAKQLYDLFSRTNATLRGARYMLRDYINAQASAICWRWATTGVCRFEKLSHYDRFGSFCADKHLLVSDSEELSTNRWPQSGQVKINLTHVVSPNEFYFWFEAHRDITTGPKWTRFKSTGLELMRKIQPELDTLKNKGIRSVPLEQIRKGCIYAVYFAQEARVDRVLLLDEPKHEIKRSKRAELNAATTSMARINPLKEYKQQVPVFKIDYGSRLEVFVENIIQLPSELARIEPQCHRGFHIGFKPNSDEPNWHSWTKRQFYEKVTVHNLRHITVWLRMNRERCFWFDNMVVSRQLTNIDSTDILDTQPHRELAQDGLAECTKSEPSFLPPSPRLITLGKWNTLKLAKSAQYAFLRKDKAILDIFLLNAYGHFELVVRQIEFNKNLIELEDKLLEDYSIGKLARQQHIAPDVYCLARIKTSQFTSPQEEAYTVNRVKIKSIMGTKASTTGANLDMPEDSETSEEYKYKIECLDHGDCCVVGREDLFEAPAKYFATLPFQAIKCKLANVNRKLMDDVHIRNKVNDLIFYAGRTGNNQNKIIKCRIDDQGNLYLYATKDGQDNTYHPMSEILQDENIQLHESSDPEYERIILPEFEKKNLSPGSDAAKILITEAILSILNGMARDELLAAGADHLFIEKKSATNGSSTLDLD